MSEEDRELTVTVDARQLVAVADRWQALADHMHGAMEPVAQRVQSLGGQLATLMTEAFRAYPPNWPTDEWERVATLVSESRWPLVWVPRREVVEALLNASVEERDNVLVAHSASVLDDCAEVLASVNADETLRELADIEHEAVVAFRSEAAAASQALSAALVTTLVHRTGFKNFPKARRKLAVDVMAARLGDLRLAAIQSCIPTTFRPSTSGTTTFNRNATVHDLSRTHLTERNALVALMLATAWLRELDSQLGVPPK